LSPRRPLHDGPLADILLGHEHCDRPLP